MGDRKPEEALHVAREMKYQEGIDPIFKPIRTGDAGIP